MKKIIALLGLGISLMTPHLLASEYITEDLLKSEKRSTGFYIKPSGGYWTRIGDSDKDDKSTVSKLSIAKKFDALRVAGRIDIGKHINQFFSIEAGFGVYYANNPGLQANLALSGNDILRDIRPYMKQTQETFLNTGLNDILHSSEAQENEICKSMLNMLENKREEFAEYPVILDIYDNNRTTKNIIENTHADTSFTVSAPHYFRLSAIISPIININFTDNFSLYGTAGIGVESDLVYLKKLKADLRLKGSVLNHQFSDYRSSKEIPDKLLMSVLDKKWLFLGIDLVYTLGLGITLNLTDATSVDISYRYKNKFYGWSLESLLLNEYDKDHNPLFKKYLDIEDFRRGEHVFSIGTRIYL